MTDRPEPVPEAGPRVGRGRPVLEGLLLIVVGLVLAALASWWLARPRAVERSHLAVRSAWGREPDGPYIGERACRECHPVESASYPGSGHARTLHLAAGLPLTRQLDGRTVPDPEAPGVTWSYALRDGGLQADRAEAGAVERSILDYAFGSGHHATTFLTLTAPDGSTAREHRLTHFRATDTLGITPGQRAAAPSPGTTPHGRDLSAEETRKCFRCHATRISSSSGEGLEVRDLIPNVSCERCHGPARRHAADATAGLADLPMPFGPGRWTAETQLSLCGECHRHPSRAAPGLIRPENLALARFQPVGISQSKCYKESAGALSCVTCHDPHARASTDRAAYERACLRCHQPPRNAACPVSPLGGCINCHMPKVDAGQRVLFTDHWIRVREPAAPPQGRTEGR